MEGIYRKGLFRQLKAYKLLQPVSGVSDQPYIRYKGLCKNARENMKDSSFGQETKRGIVYRRKIAPTAAYTMQILETGMTTAQPANLKRRVTENGIHSFPLA
jgi:hypothetical protein